MKALVTGASSGIGKDIAIYLSELGYDLILVSRDINRLQETAKEIKTNVELYPVDLTGKDNCFKLYDKFKDEKIDILVNNAGFGLFGNTWDVDINKELKMIDLNIVALHILTKLFLKDMVARDSGYILNVASSAGFLAGPVLNTYYATKNYVTKWTMGIYEELRKVKSNVHISCLCPGPVNTNFNKVAGGSFNMKALSSDYVAKYGIDKMFKNKLIIIPGFTVRLGVFLNRFISNKLSLRIVYHIQSKKVKRNG
ncbi:MAG TPA: SDR family oxidoreductase [Candidatus Coprovivens excrementavium]|nr:SDR family oxidoreductase [Candidatus Coprovivens excrementavium]